MENILMVLAFIGMVVSPAVIFAKAGDSKWR